MKNDEKPLTPTQVRDRMAGTFILAPFEDQLWVSNRFFAGKLSEMDSVKCCLEKYLPEVAAEPRPGIWDVGQQFTVREGQEPPNMAAVFPEGWKTCDTDPGEWGWTKAEPKVFREKTLYIHTPTLGSLWETQPGIGAPHVEFALAAEQLDMIAWPGAAHTDRYDYRLSVYTATKDVSDGPVKRDPAQSAKVILVEKRSTSHRIGVGIEKHWGTIVRAILMPIYLR